MVNLFEPILFSFIKNRSILPSSPPENVSNPKLQKAGLIQNHIQPELRLTQVKEETQAVFPDSKRSFFSEAKTTQWMEILRDQDPKSKELSLHWNFLFPEIPWAEERIYWEDEKKKSKFFASLASKKDTHLLCVLFDSLRTGKVWIYLEYHPTSENTSSVFFQTEKESMKRRIYMDKPELEAQLRILGKIRIQVETNNDNLAKMTHIGRGRLA